MKNIQPFITLGWHTVPLRGELQRIEGSDKKTLPKFEKDWKDKYAVEVNTIATKIGGAMTGPCSNIIAIDCDNTATYTLFKALDPEYTFEFKSLNKVKQGELQECGTFIYEYDEDLADNFGINDGVMALDFYSTNGFIYLPTDANTTKVAWAGTLPKLKAIPPAVKMLLQQLVKAPVHSAADSAIPQNVMTAYCLAPLVKQFTHERKFLPGLFKILTPKDFRQEPQYVKEGYLHPSNIPEGRGSEYMSKVSAILGADISIDESLYCATMHDINALWAVPMDDDRIDQTVIDPMISGKSSIGGVPIWKYDENWSKYRFILHTKRQSSIELGFDDRRNLYYCVDAANEHIKSFNRDSEYMAYISSVAVNPPKKLDMKTGLPIINVTSVPNKPFGFFADTDPTARTLNTFMRTPELSIIEDPAAYAKLYKYPDTTIKFIETLVPEERMRTYLLKFLRRKLKTFEYSPAVLYFLGKPGSGKDTLVQILEKIMGKIARPTTREFLELFNGWMLDTYFVQLDEYGNQLTTMRDKEEALGKLKAYTGKQNVQIRQMRTDGFMYQHHVTFIATANSNPFGIEDGDRRIALFNTPNVLVEQDWISDITDMHAKLMEETCDFCYYLATEIEEISGSEYMKPPESDNKQELIADNMYASQRLAFVLRHGMMDYLKNLATDYNCAGIKDAINRGRIRARDLEELYDVMTDYKGEMRSLNKAIRMIGIEIKATTTGGEKDYYYNLNYLDGDDSPFGAD